VFNTKKIIDSQAPEKTKVCFRFPLPHVIFQDFHVWEMRLFFLSGSYEHTILDKNYIHPFFVFYFSYVQGWVGLQANEHSYLMMVWCYIDTYRVQYILDETL